MKLSMQELREKAASLRDPHLRHDFDTLVSIEKSGPSGVGFEAALATRKALASDTIAPDWLRQYAAEVVDEVRPLDTGVTPA